MMNSTRMADRSSLEEMLDSLRRRDDKPKDVPPALPSRPPSRARLPSARRSLPGNFKVGNADLEKLLLSQEKEKDEKAMAWNGGIYSDKKVAKVGQEESQCHKFESYEEWSGEDDVNKSPMSFPDSDAKFSQNLWSENNSSFVLKKNLHVWCHLSDIVWELGNIQSLSGQYANIILSDGKILTVHRDHLLPANPDIVNGTDHLIKLIHVNEPSVLYNLKCRYADDMIYTKAGPLLIAFNPFKKAHLYEKDLLGVFKHKTLDAPHVYNVADDAFANIMRDGTDQSVVISGESGTGKTETAKMVVQYLFSFGGDSILNPKVLHTNPILEAFGNAKTLTNNNSSRFGKLIEIQFMATGRICGAKIQTFLLEKSRVVQRANGERSYHIFYQLCAGAPLYLKDKFNLKSSDEYEYLTQSDCLSISDVYDAQMFCKLMEALDIIGICKGDQENAFAMLAAILWLGNVKFEVIENQKHVQVIPGEAATSTAKLIGCKVDELIIALSTCTIRAENDSITQRLTLQQAIDARDALAKLLYTTLFEWLVEQINSSLQAEKRCSGRCISVLDIYGFESFQKNSFEQFCVNYANERLQQHFIRHLLKLEQEDYTRDCIYWNHVDFIDNANCINLFEKKPFGLFSLLDEEMNFPKSTHLTLVNKLQKHFSSNPCFKVGEDGAFKISHYAGEVIYDTSAFLEKNREPLYSDSAQFFQSCNSLFLQSLAFRMLNKPRRSTSLQWLNGAESQHSIGTKFKDQLFRMVQYLESTTPHFIRCVKPNSKKIPGLFEDAVILKQLRYCEVLEIVRISKSGYPDQITYHQFAERYGFLIINCIDYQDSLSVSISILHQFNILPEMYQLGYTKLFFRSGQIDALENARKKAIERVIFVQKKYRMLQARRCFQELKHAAIILQSFTRAYLVRKTFFNLKCNARKEHSQDNVNGERCKILQEMKDFSEKYPQKHAFALAEYERKALHAEAMLSQKEEECAALREKLQLTDINRFENDVRTKSSVEIPEKQITSLQLSLLAAPKASKPEKPDISPALHNHRNYDSEGGTSGVHTPDITPPRRQHPVPVSSPPKDVGNSDIVGLLTKELEQKIQVFENDTRLNGQHNPEDELKKLKARFYAWKKDFKARLREAKATLRKSGVSDCYKNRKRWWVKRAKKI